MGRRASSFPFRLPRLSPVAMWLLPLTLGACSSSTPPVPPATTAKAPDAGFLNRWRSGHDPRTRREGFRERAAARSYRSIASEADRRTA